MLKYYEKLLRIITYDSSDVKFLMHYHLFFKDYLTYEERLVISDGVIMGYKILYQTRSSQLMFVSCETTPEIITYNIGRLR